MTTLRILVAAPMAARSGAPWALHDAAGACVATGRGPASAWPDAQRIEARRRREPGAARVGGAAAAAAGSRRGRGGVRARGSAGRPCRRPVAGGGAAAAGRPRRDGDRRARAAGGSARARGAGRRCRASRGSSPSPSWPTRDTGACWCVADDRDAGDGFVRLADGSAIAVGPVHADGTLPPELVLAIARPQPRRQRDASRCASTPPRATRSSRAGRARRASPSSAASPGPGTRRRRRATTRAVDLLQREFALTARRGRPEAARACSCPRSGSPAPRSCCTSRRRSANGRGGASRHGARRRPGARSPSRPACRRPRRRRRPRRARRSRGGMRSSATRRACPPRRMRCRCSPAWRRHWRRCRRAR